MDNGKLPPIADQLRAEIARERERRAEAERLVSESREKERRYQKALDALEPSPKPKPVAKNWSISDERVEMVYRRLGELRAIHPNQAISAGWLGDHTPGLSPETARRALIVLREQERVRLIGSTRGGGKAYDLMPNAS